VSTVIAGRSQTLEKTFAAKDNELEQLYVEPENRGRPACSGRSLIIEGKFLGLNVLFLDTQVLNVHKCMLMNTRINKVVNNRK
jgi:hypothetical protein